jgi:tetratricopeptide (TPR) repeat protein
MAHDVFISYASRDKVLADAVCGRLETRHIRCWIAPRDVAAGTAYADAIIGALSACRIVVVLLSSESIASPHVASELERALHNGKAILPVRIEDVYPTGSLEYYLAGKHWLDALTPPMEVHLEKVAEAAARLLDLEVKQTIKDPSIIEAPAGLDRVLDDREVKQGPMPVAESAPPPPKPSGFQASRMFKEAKALETAGQYAQAVPIYRQVLQMFEALDDKPGAALCVSNMAFCLIPHNNPAGTWAEALATFRKALSLFEALGDEPNQVTVHGNIGYCLRPDNNPAGNWQEAGEAFRRKATLAGKLGDKAEEAGALARAGWCATPTRNPQGNWQESETLQSQAARLYEELNDGLNQGFALHNQGFCQIQGQEANLTDETRRLFRRAAEVFRGVGAVKDAEDAEYFVNFRASAADEVYNRAVKAHNANQWAQAAPLYAQAAEVFASEGNRSRQALCLHGQAWCLEPEHNPAGSWAICVELYRKAAELRAGIGDAAGQARTLGNLGVALFPTKNPAGNWAEACEVLQQAVELYHKTGDKDCEGTCLTNLACACQPDDNPGGSWEKAIDLHKAALALKVAAHASTAAALGNLSFCFNPQNNPAGDWLQAGAYYRQAGEAYHAEGKLKEAGVCLHRNAFCLMRGDGKNMTEETWEMFRTAAQYRRQAGDIEGAKSSESWLH